MERFEALRSLLNTAIIAAYAHIHIRKVSIVQWTAILGSSHPRRWVDAEQGSFIVSALVDLPSLRELELGKCFLPTRKSDYESDEWFNLMDSLHSNKGYLRVIAARMQTIWWFDWRIVGGRNFGWNERLLLKTSVDVNTWDELVDMDLGNYDFNPVFETTMQENWSRGPLKNVTVEHNDKSFKVRIWGVPENVRRREARRIVRREAKAAYEEQRNRGLAKKGKLVRGLCLDSGLDEDEGEGEDEEGSDGLGAVRTRNRKILTREEARAKRMERQRNQR
jgi:hypothetical protein